MEGPVLPGVRCLSEHLRRQELRGAAEGAGPVAVPHALLAQPEVGDLDVALRVQQQVVQLEVPGERGLE